MWNADRYVKTLDFAVRAHKEQKVPGSNAPYVVHLVKVAHEVQHAWAVSRDFDADLAVTCALLHDSVEDAGVTVEQLEAEFGKGVAAGVSALTKNGALPKPEQMGDSLRRLQAQPRDVQLVKLADRITNLEEPPSYWTKEKRLAYRDEAKVILDALGSAHAGLAQRLETRRAAYLAFC